MRNTLLVDTDLVYGRPNADEALENDDDLVEIGFEDMEPIEGFDLVGIEPHTAIAILPFMEFDIVGVGEFSAVATTPVPAFPRATGDLEPDMVPTEEYTSWDEEAGPADF